MPPVLVGANGPQHTEEDLFGDVFGRRWASGLKCDVTVDTIVKVVVERLERGRIPGLCAQYKLFQLLFGGLPFVAHRQ